MKNLKLSLVGFFDILGYKELVRQIKSEADLKRLDAKLKKIQNLFVDSLEEREMFDKDVLIFSDSIITSLPLQSQGLSHSDAFDSLLYDIAGYAYAQWDCVTKGVFIRGGIDLDFWYKVKNRVISKGLVEAADLEPAVRVPMVGITNNAYKFISDLPGRTAYSKRTDPMTWAFVQYVPKKGKPIWCLNYMEICLSEIGPNLSNADRESMKSMSEQKEEAFVRTKWIGNYRRYLKAHASAILTAFKAAPIPKVRSKYRWLAKYHNGVIGKMTPELKDCLIRLPSVSSRKGKHTSSKNRQRT